MKRHAFFDVATARARSIIRASGAVLFSRLPRLPWTDEDTCEQLPATRGGSVTGLLDAFTEPSEIVLPKGIWSLRW